ncbi:iron-containing alcohol dehydrogenase [Cellulomonas sp. SLBN-39]|uniref:iron-containing alcohol dehydrogenase n=1 Tax=Cellulomonas sp. SLBN-39 TaxID=2768446 RepID=UPI00114E2BD5|nr:iron-containing alcohol dehydrogenase [Cellulomonas sp. SLBN-39]TQL01826.1 alcohol dehydrogenase class IV [Cellulomonas sp. SLBN-39]
MPTFSTAGRVVVGAGEAEHAAALVASLGRRALVVAGGHADVDVLVRAAGHELDEVHVWRRRGEPDVAGVRAGVEVARAFGPDVVVGWGGGSVLDTAKAVAALHRGTGDVLDHLEVVGRGLPLPAPGTPVVAVPTTSGTGAEVTANAPVLVPEHGVKASLRGPALLPALALVDPVLTLGCPPAVTAASGADALTQCLEAFTTPAATPLTDPLALDGLVRAGRSLARAATRGDDLDARTDMSLAALLSGMALANARLGAVHGLAAALGGAVHAGHGEICAAVLVATTAANVAALRRSDPDGDALRRYARAAQALTGRPTAGADDAAPWLRDALAPLGLRGLRALGLDDAAVPDVARAALAASSMRGNPVTLTPAEVEDVLRASA